MKIGQKIMDLLPWAVFAIALGVVVYANTACARPTEDIENEGENFIELQSELYTTHLLRTKNDEVDFDGTALVSIYQSAGRGTNWGGVTGTAYSDAVYVNFETWSNIIVQGNGSDTYGKFTQIFGDDRYKFEFSDFKPYDSDGSSAVQELNSVQWVDLLEPGGGLNVYP